MKALDDLQLNNNNNNERTCIYLSNLHSLKKERKSRGSFGCLFDFFLQLLCFFFQNVLLICLKLVIVFYYYYHQCCHVHISHFFLFSII